MMSKRTAAGAVVVALLVSWTASQWVAIGTENVNWDEFAFLSRASASVRTGTLAGGGRPGLAALFLIPFVEGCTNSVDAIRSARVLWLAFVVLYLAGIYVFVRLAARDGADASAAAAVSVALMASVPVFMRWSLQVRTDQPAAMFALWGGVCLVAAARRPTLAYTSGVLFALGMLCSQKAAYAGALSFVVFVPRTLSDSAGRRIAVRRAAGVLAAVAISGAATIVAYYAILSMFLRPASIVSTERALNTFAYYRRVFGYRAYSAMLPTLLAQGWLILLAAGATVLSARARLASRGDLLTAWAILALGCAIGAFHAGAFPYFWITLGLFPATAIGLAWRPIVESFGTSWARWLPFASVPLLALTALRGAAIVHRDTQRVQRDALAFIDRNFASTARGFQAEGALACRADPDPFPTYFAENARLLAGDEGRARADALIDQFRRRPVAFMITQRLFPFPDPVQSFWDLHYVLYRDEVMIAGGRIHGRSGDTVLFDVVVPGRYRWLPGNPQTARIQSAGRTLAPREEIELGAGMHQLTLVDEVKTGMIALGVSDEPAADREPFYALDAIRELDPLGPRFAPPERRYLPIASGGSSR